MLWCQIQQAVDANISNVQMSSELLMLNPLIVLMLTLPKLLLLLMLLRFMMTKMVHVKPNLVLQLFKITFIQLWSKFGLNVSCCY